MNKDSNPINFSRPPYDFVCDYLKKSLTTAMLSLDNSGIITEANPFICQQLFQENLVGTNIRDYLKPENHSLFDPGSLVLNSPLVLSFERQGYGPLLLFSHVYPGENGCFVIGEQTRLSDDQILRKMSLLNNELTTLSRESRREARNGIIAKQKLQAKTDNLSTKLSKSEKNFRLLADHTNDWEYWINPKGNFEYITPACEQITGYSVEEFKSDPQLLYRIVSHQDDEIVREHFKQETFGQAGTCCLEFMIMTKAGQECWLEHQCLPIFDEQGKHIGRRGNNRDITKRKREELKRLELERQLAQKHKVEALGMMASGMVHNFNNNLAIILGNVELAQLRQLQNSEFIPLLNNAKIAALRARDLVNKILIHSRDGAQNKELVKLPVVVNETINLLRSTIPTTVDLEQIIKPDSDDVMVNADFSQIQEALFNLCNNAVHSMDEKGELKVFSECVDLLAQDIPIQYGCLPGQYVKLSVQDTGSGMSEEVLCKIFDPFFTTKDADEGTGMGLATVQGIMKQHNGLIKVKSTLGKGTVFELYFPVVDQNPTVGVEHEDTTLPGGTEHILFVDDDEMLVSLGKEFLTDAGYQVTTMTESTEALKVYATNPDDFDLLITDQTMPKLSGKELIQEIKKIKPDILTILCTGYSSKINEKDAKELGINAFWLKPLKLCRLAQAVRRVLDGNKEE